MTTFGITIIQACSNKIATIDPVSIVAIFRLIALAHRLDPVVSDAVDPVADLQHAGAVGGDNAGPAA